MNEKDVKSKRSPRKIFLGICLIFLAIMVCLCGLWYMYVFGVKTFSNGLATHNFKQIVIGFLQIFPVGCWIELAALLLARCGYLLLTKIKY